MAKIKIQTVNINLDASLIEENLKLKKMLEKAVEEAYQNEVVDTGMWDVEEYNKEEWIEMRLLEWQE